MADRPSFQNLLAWLRSQGPQSPADLMARFELSQSTLFRWIKNAPQELVALGSPRSRKVAALRKVRGLDAKIPVFRVSSKGEVLQIGELITIYPSSSIFVSHATPTQPEYFPGLPFYLDDVRPQGFLGRSFTARHADLRLPSRITDWGNEDILEAMALRGEDLSGDLLMGAKSFERYQSSQQDLSDCADADKPEEKYIALAQAAMDGHPPGSSAGGEHPKFCAKLKSKKGLLTSVLVKFSPLGDSFSAQRWSDLLVCEFLALETLREHGIAAAEARLIQAGGRTFLETIRFDRVGSQGRRGMISLAALENQWVGRGENWAVSATALEHDDRIAVEDLKSVRILECFGRLIANSDRHSGNLSFFWEQGETQVRLAPVYDMLPMFYAPINGEDPKKVFSMPTYDHTLIEAWKKALPIAKEYWKRVTGDTRVSAEFKQIARGNLEKIS